MNDYPLTLFHDGDCPICRFDIANLKARNQAGQLRFVDLADPKFDPSAYDKSLDELRAQIHAQRPDGSFAIGMEVFRLAYRAVGLGWVVAPAQWRPLRGPADALYLWFARHRSWLSRRLGLIFDTLSAWQASRRISRCRDGTCSTTPTP